MEGDCPPPLGTQRGRSMSVPKIETDNDNIAPTRGIYTYKGKEYEVLHPTELGLRQIRMLMNVGRDLAAFSDPDSSDKQIEEAMKAARKIMTTVSNIPEKVVNEAPELEVFAFANSFFEEFNDTINLSSRIRYR